ncbi:hypothetical protein AB0D67_30795 [Streptosporangium sp. NPDC048047]|uniref:hypothetical protein n=1 Tax=Streptosporangium sp. NPDC048047 TaxID=3155748 RepID=UPI0034176E7C
MSHALPDSGAPMHTRGDQLIPLQTAWISAQETSTAAGHSHHADSADAPWAAQHALAAETWARLTPLIAQSSRLRLSPDGGATFPGGRHSRQLTPRRPALPAVPATVSVYHPDLGEGRLLVADLDVSRALRLGLTRPHAIARVEAEAEAITDLITRCGGRAICDVSPSGGRHIYIRFARALPWTELRRLTLALARRFPTLDPSPMSSVSGQIRPPGAPHKITAGHLTGYMRLTIPLDDAEAILRRPNGPAVWTALTQELTAELAALTTPPNRTGTNSPADTGGNGDLPGPGPLGAGDGRTCPHCDTLLEIPLDRHGRPWLPRLGGRRPLPAALENLARTGDWRARGTTSASEARLGLLNSIAAAGWTYDQAVTQMRQGPWAGLPVLLESRRLSYRMTRLAADWQKAVTGVAWNRHARNCNTSVRRPSTPPAPSVDGVDWVQGRGLQRTGLYNVDSNGSEFSPSGTVPAPDLRDANLWSIRTATWEEADNRALEHWQQIRQWRTCVWLAERDTERVRSWGRAAASIRLLLRAIAVAARMDGSVTPAFGCRSLSEMTGLDYTVVSRHLRRLREEDDPLIDLVEAASGRRADRYALRVPEAYRAQARWIRWPAGPIDALHPALHALGAVAALVYEELSTAETGAAELARLALLSPSAVAEALRTLAAYQLAVRSRSGWTRGERPLRDAAVELGADVTKKERHVRYRAHRQAWWDLLEAWQLPPMDRPIHLRARAETRKHVVLDSTTAEELGKIPWPQHSMLGDDSSEAFDPYERAPALAVASAIPSARSSSADATGSRITVSLVGEASTLFTPPAREDPIYSPPDSHYGPLPRPSPPRNHSMP